MNTKEKIGRATDTTVLCLHKEGIFYKLYDRHAMLFTENIKSLKIKTRFIKAAGQQVYSCGFPASIVEEIKQRLVNNGGIVDESGKVLTAVNIKWARESDYEKWCEQHLQESAGADKAVAAGLTNIEKQIVDFPVIGKSPLEAMNFIIELQKELRQRQ